MAANDLDAILHVEHPTVYAWIKGRRARNDRVCSNRLESAAAMGGFSRKKSIKQSAAERGVDLTKLERRDDEFDVISGKRVSDLP